MLGGYLLIDLKGINLTVGGQAVKCEGVYERIEGNYGKPVVIGNYQMAGVAKPERYVTLGVNGTTFEGNIGIDAEGTGLFIHIAEGDMVSLTE